MEGLGPLPKVSGDGGNAASKREREGVAGLAQNVSFGQILGEYLRRPGLLKDRRHIIRRIGMLFMLFTIMISLALCCVNISYCIPKFVVKSVVPQGKKKKTSQEIRCEVVNLT